MNLLTKLSLLVLLLPFQALAGQPPETAVVIYGGTPSGVIAAVAVARAGQRVVLLEPTTHIGGMMTSGLSNADKGTGQMIGGFAREFFRRVGAHYGKPLTWRYEPHIAERVFLQMLQEARVEIVFGARLASVEKDSALIRSVRVHGGKEFRAKVFIDSSYEGDLLALSGGTYRIGRESARKYGERFAGVRPRTKGLRHHWHARISPYLKDGSLLPGIRKTPLEPFGTGDDKTQAYNFRLCVTRNKSKLVSFEKPEQYDPKSYELLGRYLKVRPKLKFSDLFYLGKLPNAKFDLNNTGPFSTDLIGGGWKYPDADHETRQKIVTEHIRYSKGLFHFLVTDSRVSKKLQRKAKSFGLCRDEFQDNGFWPYQLYVREARRMVGEYVMTERDLERATSKEDRVAMGYSRIESHHLQRAIHQNGYVINEGFLFIDLKGPYDIPYRALLPQKSELSNLIVPVALSSSHIAFSSLRMEPQFMMLGHAAGLAASQAIQSQKKVHDISIEKLQSTLKEQGQILTKEHSFGY